MDLSTLQRLALDVAQARSLDSLLGRMVTGLAGAPGAALVRCWLKGPGDLCDECALADVCPDRTRCLHLVASKGKSVDGTRWDRLNGDFRRFPLGVRKVGRVGASGQPILLRLQEGEEHWAVRPEWARTEGIRTFAGQPLVFRGEVLGVLAVFCRDDVSDEAFGWLRTFADQAAVAIANARAFEEVEELRARLELERDYLRDEVEARRSFGGIVGESPAIRHVLRQVEQVAVSDATVLISGETGTGKELVASAIHELSPRSEQPLVRVNCASIPSELFESEFFGHAKGAFTGAAGDRAGRFQVADGGTLFLDEVGEIPPGLQGKLLRALQEGQFSRVGEDSVREVDVRVVAATNRDLAAEVEAGRFREDLYYRLSVFPIVVPPLRERRGDVPLLAAHFLRKITTARNLPGLVLRKRDVEALSAYDWPGNVRELHNVIERAVILSSRDRLHIDLADHRPPGRGAGAAAGAGPTTPDRGWLTEGERLNFMRRHIQAALEASGGKVSGAGGAAERLGIRPSTLSSRMKSLGMR